MLNWFKRLQRKHVGTEVFVPTKFMCKCCGNSFEVNLPYTSQTKQPFTFMSVCDRCLVIPERIENTEYVVLHEG